MYYGRIKMNKKWVTRFKGLADHFATWSEDTSTKVGCVLVDIDNHAVISPGFNGLPRGINKGDTLNDEGIVDKYLWYEHAERNAIYNAAQLGVSTRDSVAFVTHMPCCDCMRALAQSGITKIYFNKDNKMGTDKWVENFKVSKKMARKLNIPVMEI
jgi:dCMP deaminase